MQLGHPPKRIDILTSVDGVDFEPCWDRHIDVTIGGQIVPFLSIEDLIANKKRLDVLRI
ncbi:hypothetical protein [Nocardia amamiensis]|uniref:hypothetical protein n=1 Tax=Nocardia amamiensis TaxID=404578 RepID=UPI0033F5C2A6